MSKVSLPIFTRDMAGPLRDRLREPRRLLHVVAGPRQVGKTTLVRQVLASIKRPHRFVSADEPTLRDTTWLTTQWVAARLLAREAEAKGAILAVDEVQKVSGWSETVKRLWDEDTASGVELRVVLLGSAPLLLQDGLTESLTGRFEQLRLPHWTFKEMQSAFGFSINQYLFFGGYLRRLFELACRYSGQILSFNKMLGQLQDAGNTTTLAHYLDLLSGVGMVTGIPKYAGEVVRQRASSPKLQVLNTALVTAQSGLTPNEATSNPEFWGRLTESAIGAHLANAAALGEFELFYWRERSREVDFVLRAGQRLLALEVKSSRAPTVLPGLKAFCETFHPQRTLLVGSVGISVEGFLSRPVGDWLS